MERFYKRKKVELQCEVVTPMFLGGAGQEAEWRAAPFKALLRSWWRVTQHGVGDAAALAREEGRLFGRAGDDDDSGKSLVRVFVQSNAKAVKNSLPDWDMIIHPNCIDPRRNPKGKIKPLLYLAGMGLAGPKLQVKHTYFPPEASFILAIDYPSGQVKNMERIFALIQAFGTVGGRSRNGWGSFMITNPPIDPEPAARLLTAATRNWTDGLNSEYPNCLGCNGENPLLWKTELREEWKLAMKDLAEAYIEVRAKQVGSDGELNPGMRNNHNIQERHLLGIPLTNHNYGGGAARHASPLRFVVKKQDGKFRGYILHVPHGHSRQQPLASGVTVQKVWEKVHRKLDRIPNLLTRATYPEVLS
ncbi:MAG TPA: hypothetical protein ENN06_10420 [Desulfobacteraceae bacterium]|nr:hypothetical protein [Desulfobacteraceae bacterium]